MFFKSLFFFPISLTKTEPPIPMHKILMSFLHCENVTSCINVAQIELHPLVVGIGENSSMLGHREWGAVDCPSNDLSPLLSEDKQMAVKSIGKSEDFLTTVSLLYLARWG